MNRFAFSRKLLAVKSLSGWASRPLRPIISSLLSLRSLLLLLGLASGCASPQRAGAERTTFLTMATTSGALAGSIGGVVGCGLARYGLSHPPQGRDRKDIACAIGGAVVGGAAALYGSAEAEREPEAAQWVVFSLGTAVAAVVIGSWIVDALD